MITRKILERKGCIIETASDGAKALSAFIESEIGYFSIIITDVRMLVMDGLEEARQIRTRKCSDAKKIPIIALTADAFNDAQKKIFEAGMTARLVKPVEPELMYAKVAGLLKNDRTEPDVD